MQNKPKDDRGVLRRAHIALTQEQYDRIKKANEQIAELLSGTKSTPSESED